MSNQKLNFKLRRLAELSKDEIWLKYLKPELEEMKRVKAESEALPTSSFESVKNDIVRATTLQVINKIIRLVDNAEAKLTSK